MEEKELNVLLEKVDSKVVNTVKAEIQAAMTGIVKTDELTEKLNELKVNDLTIKEIAEAVKSQGETLKTMQAERKNARIVKTLPQIFAENKAKFDALRNKETRMITFDVPLNAVKTAVTINSSITTDPAGAVLPGLNDTGIPPTGLELAFTRLTLPANHHGIIRYTDLTTRTNNATYIAEGAQQASDQVYAWTGASKTVEKVLATVPISWESVNDSVEMELAVRRLLVADAETIRQTQLYTGSGTAPQIAGVYQVFAQSYTAASGVVQSANIYDLVMHMKNQIISSYGSKFNPDIVLMNPTDALKAKWTKDELGNYVRNPFVSPDGMTVAGMRIIESPYVTVNTLVVGDSRYGYYYQGETAEVEMGYDGNNFSYDLMMLKARLRHALVIRTADAYAYLKSTDIAADLATLTTV